MNMLEWFSGYMDRITEVENILDSFLHYDRGILSAHGVTGNIRRKEDSYVTVCYNIDKEFFYDVVAPVVREFVTKKYPGSRVISREYASAIKASFSGGLLVSWQPGHLSTPEQINAFWEGYPEK